jgi:hypothetical protein
VHPAVAVGGKPRPLAEALLSCGVSHRDASQSSAEEPRGEPERAFGKAIATLKPSWGCPVSSARRFEATIAVRLGRLCAESMSCTPRRRASLRSSCHHRSGGAT